MNLTIAELPEHEWQKYRDIRLLALKNDPYAFGSSNEEEINLSETDWRNRIKAVQFAIINGEVVGLIGLLRGDNLANKHCGHIISLWVKPTLRGRGIAKKLVEKLQKLAQSSGIRKLSLHVSITQPAALRVYENLGFKHVGLLKENLLKDGIYLDEYLMEWHVNMQ